MNTEPLPKNLNPDGTLLAIFPIDNFIAFPDTIVPLHIFEPRYRRMIEDIMATDEKLLILTNLNSQQLQPHKIGVLGEILSQEMLADGRSNIIVNCISRVEVKEYFRPYSNEEYAIGETNNLHDIKVDSELENFQNLIPDLINAFKAHFETIAGDKLKLNDDFSFLDLTMEKIIHTICQISNLDIEKKIQLLQIDNIVERGITLKDYLTIEG